MLKLDGKPVSQKVMQENLVRSESFQKKHGRPPGLHVVLVGDDPASQVYVGHKEKAATKLGFQSHVDRVSADISQEEMVTKIQKLNADPNVDGILIQLPLPGHLDSEPLLDLIDPMKDVDGLHPENIGLLAKGTPRVSSCTPSGVIEILKHYDISIAGKKAVVIGRSLIVGKPMALLLLNENATPTVCHSRTQDLAHHTKDADIVVVAAGKPQFLDASAFSKDCVVIDVGIHRTETGLVGDVDFEKTKDHVQAITPVPGGVGKMTIAMLMKNTLDLAELRMSQ